MNNEEKPVANPYVMLREEFDDWAVLFDPDTGHGFGLSPTGVYVWKLLDGEHSIDEMLDALRRDAVDMPHEAGEHLLAFLEELARQGLAAYETEQVQEYRRRLLLRPAHSPENVPDAMQFTYQTPLLVNLNSPSARGDCDRDCGTGTSVWHADCNADGCSTTYSCNSNGISPSDCGTGNGTSNCDSSGSSTQGWCNSNGAGTDACWQLGSSPTYHCYGGGGLGIS